MKYLYSVLPRAARALRGPSNPVSAFRCFYTPSNPRLLPGFYTPSSPRQLPVPRNQDRSQRRSFHSSPRSAVANKNPYSALGIDKTASASDIKKAYYTLAKKWHPDQNKEPSARDKFQEVQAAYEILSDPAKKEEFDQFGEAGFDPSSGDSAGDSAGPFGSGSFAGAEGRYAANFSFEDLFSAFTGGAGGIGSASGAGRRGWRSQETVVGDDIIVDLPISFMEAAKGTSKDIKIQPLLGCKTCSGSGMKPGKQKERCGRCLGSGIRVQYLQDSLQVNYSCETCEGTGVITPRGSECGNCGGAGAKRETRKINVPIPPGIEDTMRLRLDGEGNAPVGSGFKPRRGNLYIRIRVRPHSDFTRKGADLFYTATIPLTTATLGGHVKIPTLDGEVGLKVPLGTNTGDKIVIGGKGIRKHGSANTMGDLNVELKISIPKVLNTRQRTLLEMLADEFNDKAATRIMGVNREKNDTTSSTYEQHKNESFLKRTWHNLTHQHDEMPKDDDDNENNKKKASGSG